MSMVADHSNEIMPCVEPAMFFFFWREEVSNVEALGARMRLCALTLSVSK
jgi:hypothetical protein